MRLSVRPSVREEITRDTGIPLRVLLIIMDLTAFKLGAGRKQSKELKPKKKIDHPFKVRYVNHWIEKINLGQIMHNDSLKESLPTSITDQGLPTVVYKYKPTIRGKILNYKKTVSQFQHDRDNTENCRCASSKFKDEHHGHIITGDLTIIEEKQLRKLFRKGPNYREPETLNWKTAIRSLEEDINELITNWSNKIGKPEVFFTEWKLKLMELILLKHNTLKKKITCRRVNQVLKNEDCIKELERLQNLYVLIPIDKAANNIGFVCKTYFLQVLQEETQTPSYEPSNLSEEELVKQVAEESNDLGTPITKENRELPQIHATIKMHKNPVKFRFIIGARQCVLKQAAKRLVKVLQLVMNTHRKYCNKIKFYTGIERNWMIDNNAAVLEDIQTINSKKNARNVQTFDFSTLYTKIPLEDLKEKLKETVEKAFKGGQNQFIQITKKNSRWYHSKRKESVSKDEVFSMIDLVIDNSFFKFGNRVYRQRIGIPMGIDPAPQMANLYLYAYESKFMETLTKENYGAARKFNHTRRYIDDLNTLNNDGQLEKYHKEGRIYPREMTLNQENENNNQATFLDLDQEIKDKIIMVKTFDKRDSFKFEIVNYPDLSGNIPKRPAYGVYSSQIIRYARICSRKEDLIKRVKELTRKLLRKGFTMEGMKNAAKKCLKQHRCILRKLEHGRYKHIIEECAVL